MKKKPPTRQVKPSTSAAKPALEPGLLSPLYAKHGWTPEGLREELASEGLDPDAEAEKIRSIAGAAKAKLATPAKPTTLAKPKTPPSSEAGLTAS